MSTRTLWREKFPELARLPGPASRILEQRALPMTCRAGTQLFSPDTEAKSLLLLMSGTVRVQQLSDTGREIVLYRVHAGEGCILTAACLMAHEEYSAEGIAETDIEAVSIPQDAFDELMATSPEFRALVFKSYSDRITDLLFVIEEVAFKRVDIRLAEKLVELQDANGDLHLTHNQLSVELGTAREVISRQLAEFQRRGWVALKRGIVSLKDVAALGRLAKSG